jgi:hypothetical protein
MRYRRIHTGKTGVFRNQQTDTPNKDDATAIGRAVRASTATIARPFSIRLSSTRCGVEILKTVERLTQLLELPDSTGPNETHLHRSSPDPTSFAASSITAGRRLLIAMSETHDAGRTACPSTRLA